jgi:pimeloyl-ACP methyl ester carboxylesterase
MPASLATTAPTRFLEVGDTRFAYRRFGTPAGPPLVFAQHFMGNLDNFDPAIADALATGREIILFDNAGVGSSTGTAPSTVEGIAAGAASFIDGLGLSTVDILGHSMGGEVAQLVALDRPDLVRRLVLVGTGPRGADAIARQGPDVGPLFGQRDELGEDMWLPIMFSPSKESQAAGRAFISRITARTEDRDIPVSGETIAAHRAAARGWASAPADDFAYLGRIAQPALVVNGSDDIVIPTINSYHLYKHLPDAELMLLPDSGHGAHFQYVERFVRRVIDFLDIQPHDTGLLTPLRPNPAEGRPDALRSEPAELQRSRAPRRDHRDR